MNKRVVIGIFLIILGLGGIAFSAVALWQWYIATHVVYVPTYSATVTRSVDIPEEAPIDTNNETYNVPANQPRLLEISSIGVRGFIQRVGIDQFGAIATPPNIHMVGWYINSPKPGEDGISIIDGHVLGRYNDAIFAKLDRVKPGDSVAVTYGDKRRVNFSVVKTGKYSIKETATRMFDRLPDVDQQLVLITCTGTYDKSKKTYDKRALVYAKRIDG